MHAKQLEWVVDQDGDFEASGFWGIFQVVHSENGEGFTASLNDYNNYEGYEEEDFPTAEEGKAHCQSLLEKQVQKALGFVDWAGKKTMKELANILGVPIAINRNKRILWFENLPVWDDLWQWTPSGDSFGWLPNVEVDCTVSQKDSLTLPDGWEGANAK